MSVATGEAVNPFVLIVDDNLELAENISEILNIEGCSTAVSTNAEDALPTALDGSITVLLTDYRLPGMTGAELVKQVRQRRAALPALVMSAFTDERTVNDAREAGARFLPKPVDFSLLSAFIRGLS
jgi:two-component system, OmpR family, manganese sensing response regulator